MNDIGINEILNNNAYDIDMKINKLYLYRDEVEEKVNKAIDELKSESEYCRYCERSYHKKFWTHFVREEVRRVCVHYPIVAEDKAEYKECKCEVEYRECPAGHKILVEVERID